MTVSATATFELTRDGLFRRAFQLAGLLEASMQPTGDDISMATDFLSMEIQALQAVGIVVTQISRTTLALIAGTAEYTLDSDTLDVVVGPDNQVGTVYSVAGGAETPVTAMSRLDWIAAQTKSSQSTPTLAFVERTISSVKIVFWMTPNAALTFRYAKIALPRDNSTGAVTMDLARRWQKAICFSMAYQLAMAKNAPLARVKMLEDRADREKAIASASDVEKGHMQLMPYLGSGGYR